MLNKKPLLGLAAMSIFATGSAFAQFSDREEDTTGDVVFSGEVEAQCGIEATTAEATLEFGEGYADDKAHIKIVSNTPGHVKFKASKVDFSSFGQQINEEEIFFETAGAWEDEKNATDWKKGVHLNREDLKENNTIDLAARINVDESNLDANQNYEVRTTWTIDCH